MAKKILLAFNISKQCYEMDNDNDNDINKVLQMKWQCQETKCRVDIQLLMYLYCS